MVKKVPAIVANPSEEKKASEKKIVSKKKGVDKWKKKTWFEVYSPKEFDRKQIGSTIAEKPQSLVGRTMEVSARTLSGDMKKTHITLVFRINEVKGNKAYTIAAGHEIKDSYLRKFVRRRNTKVDLVKFVNAKDGLKVKVRAMVLTANKLEQSKKTAIRKVLSEKLEAFAKEFDAQPLVSEFVFGTIPQKIFNDAKKIGQIKRVEITKSWIFSK